MLAEEEEEEAEEMVELLLRELDLLLRMARLQEPAAQRAGMERMDQMLEPPTAVRQALAARAAQERPTRARAAAAVEAVRSADRHRDRELQELVLQALSEARAADKAQPLT